MDFKAEKVLTLPTEPTVPDTVFAHRVGDGFDLWASDSAGMLFKINGAAKKYRTIDWSIASANGGAENNQWAGIVPAHPRSEWTFSTGYYGTGSLPIPNDSGVGTGNSNYALIFPPVWQGEKIKSLKLNYQIRYRSSGVYSPVKIAIMYIPTTLPFDWLRDPLTQNVVTLGYMTYGNDAAKQAAGWVNYPSTGIIDTMYVTQNVPLDFAIPTDGMVYFAVMANSDLDRQILNISLGVEE